MNNQIDCDMSGLEVKPRYDFENMFIDIDEDPAYFDRLRQQADLIDFEAEQVQESNRLKRVRDIGEDDANFMYEEDKVFEQIATKRQCKYLNQLSRNPMIQMEAEEGTPSYSGSQDSFGKHAFPDRSIEYHSDNEH